MKSIRLLFLLILISFAVSHAQEASVEKLDKQYLNWLNLDLKKDDILGISLEKAYKEFLQNKKTKKTVIVAVMDGGVDIEHEDLKGKIWVNEDEIPGNGIDDDKNGYIDDVNGWNFIGNKNGENVLHDNMECVRIYKKMPSSSPDFEKAKIVYEEELEKRTKERGNITRFEMIYLDAKKTVFDATGTRVASLDDLKGLSSPPESRLGKAINFLRDRYKAGFTDEILERLKASNKIAFNFYLNADYDSRAIIGDDPLNINDVNYGNPDVKGPRSNHGTSVTGLIAANRDNGIGINGIATDVKIMVLRTTPDGDERDKDIALAIKYAVDNGAEIINMSFGKSLSPQKKFIDDAVKYAAQKDVLIIHSAGNAGKDIDELQAYPSDRFLDGGEATNWITVGASGWKLDEKAAAPFSNYGQKHVDIFAPGENLISLDSSNTYSMNDGTSLSAPVVTGVAALILSYYPDLTSSELISILLDSSYKLSKQKVELPGSSSGTEKKKVNFSTLSTSGGIVNVYEAFKKLDSAGK